MNHVEMSSKLTKDEMTGGRPGRCPCALPRSRACLLWAAWVQDGTTGRSLGIGWVAGLSCCLRWRRCLGTEPAAPPTHLSNKYLTPHSSCPPTHPCGPAAEVKGIKDFMVDTCGVPADKFRGFRGEPANLLLRCLAVVGGPDGWACGAGSEVTIATPARHLAMPHDNYAHAPAWPAAAPYLVHNAQLRDVLAEQGYEYDSSILEPFTVRRLLTAPTSAASLGRGGAGRGRAASATRPSWSPSRRA